MAVAMRFDQSLAIGQLGESLIAHWLRNKGWHVLPAYEKEIDNGKGPRLFLATGNDESELITPDLFVMKAGEFLWVEAKHKTTFTWYGKGNYWTTGVDKRHFADYVRVQRQTGIDVWLLFLHRESETRPDDIQKWGAPPECPTGLFGQRINYLNGHYSHQSDKWGPSGMVYWRPFEHLRRIAELSDVMLSANGSLFLR
jgi:hypothetical protein